MRLHALHDLRKVTQGVDPRVTLQTLVDVVVEIRRGLPEQEPEKQEGRDAKQRKEQYRQPEAGGAWKVSQPHGECIRSRARSGSWTAVRRHPASGAACPCERQ